MKRRKCSNCDPIVYFDILTDLSMLAYLNTMPVLNNEAWAYFAALVDNYSVFILHIL